MSHCDSMWFHTVTVCDVTLWQYVMSHCDSVWFHTVTVCDVTLWQYVMSHCDSVWCHTVTIEVAIWPTAPRYVTKVTSEGHRRVMLAAKAGMMEYQAMSIFTYYCYMYGGCREVGYIPICPSGDRWVIKMLKFDRCCYWLCLGCQNRVLLVTGLWVWCISWRVGCMTWSNPVTCPLCSTKILHYGGQSAPNDRQIQDGDLCLFDMGGEYHCYLTDITTTFPVNGTFTQVQKITYEMVLDTVHAVVNRIRPGKSNTWCDVTIPGVRRHNTWRDVTIPGVTSQYLVWHHNTWCDVTIPGVTSQYLVWHHNTWCDVTIPGVTSQYLVWRHNTLCDVTIPCVTSQYLMWRHNTFCNIRYQGTWYGKSHIVSHILQGSLGEKLG